MGDFYLFSFVCTQRTLFGVECFPMFSAIDFLTFNSEKDFS